MIGCCMSRTWLALVRCCQLDACLSILLHADHFASFLLSFYIPNTICCRALVVANALVLCVFGSGCMACRVSPCIPSIVSPALGQGRCSQQPGASFGACTCKQISVYVGMNNMFLNDSLCACRIVLLREVVMRCMGNA